MAERNFNSYAHEDVSARQLSRLAKQYDGVDMAMQKGASPERFPFWCDTRLIRLATTAAGGIHIVAS